MIKRMIGGESRDKISWGVSIAIHAIVMIIVSIIPYRLGEGDPQGLPYERSINIVDVSLLPNHIRALIEEPILITSQVAEASRRPEVKQQAQRTAVQPSVQARVSPRMEIVQAVATTTQIPNVSQRVRKDVVVPRSAGVPNVGTQSVRASDRSPVDVKAHTEMSIPQVMSRPIATMNNGNHLVTASVDDSGEQGVDFQNDEGDDLSSQSVSPRPRFGDGNSVIVQRIIPRYPKAMQGTKLNGVVQLIVIVDENGKVESVIVDQSSKYDSFDEVARLTVERGWSFQALGFRYQLPVTIEYLYQGNADGHYQVRTSLGQWERLD